MKETIAPPKTADQLRDVFRDFFAARDHQVVASASLIPHDPTVLFTVAGMVPFKPYFVGDETPPHPRVVDAQKCVRAGGKHNDLDDVGRTARHLVFFEMLGNWSFGDYFKAEAIPWAWEFTTEVLGFDPERLWITVHETDDDAEQIWHEQVGVPIERIQRLGDKENFWQMGDTGPCGPCSELHIDRGAAYGPDGGPLADPSGERFMEFWNLVFMQYDRGRDGTLTPLPRPSIDTGAGLERILCLLQGVDAVWETDLMRPLIDEACSLTGRTYLTGDYHDRDSFAMRVLAEHARSATMLVADGVFPSNEARGYVLRRIIRRAVRYAYLLGTSDLVMPKLTSIAIDVMGNAYPEVAKQRDFVTGVITNEEERFRHTLRNGLTILDDALAGAGEQLEGNTAFLLHDTYGFPLELTQEIAAERGTAIDLAGFETEMAAQRERAKAARKGDQTDDRVTAYRHVLEQFGTTEFTGYQETDGEAQVLAVLDVAAGRAGDADDGGEASGDGDASPNGDTATRSNSPSGSDEQAGRMVEIFLDRTPFYAESGGQIGDTGYIGTDTGRAEVVDTTFALPNLRRHLARITDGTINAGQQATVGIDVARRDAIRRNHTGTHIVHHALRAVLGEHVKQAGSEVGPDRLRFDFSHYEPVTDEQIAEIERIANTETLTNTPVRAFETTMDEANSLGAIAFFGDKYGDMVRVLEAGHSIELCGGTHVSATGDIGTIKIVSESSIGANLRRIEAVTGDHAVALLQRDERSLTELSRLVGAPIDEVVEGTKRKLDEIKALQDEIKTLRAQLSANRAGELAGSADERGAVVARVDDLAPSDLRDLAIAVRQQPAVAVAVLIGATPTGGVSIVAAVEPATDVAAVELIRDAAKAVGGGGGGKGDVATAGGKDTSGIDEALSIVADVVAAKVPVPASVS